MGGHSTRRRAPSGNIAIDQRCPPAANKRFSLLEYSATMFEAQLSQGSILKKLVDAVKELCTEVNFDVSTAGIGMQAMDSSHVCLVTFTLNADGFEHFRCDRPITLGINLASLSKILKCAGNDDSITLKATDDGDTLTLLFESEKQDRVSDFALKLMSIDAEQLGIPEQEFSAEAQLPSAEYQRIMRDLASIGDTVSISATKDGIKFSTSGDVGTANITLRHNPSSDNAKETVHIQLNEPVSLNFSLRYLNNFAKATPMAMSVKIGLSKEVPVVVEYTIESIGFVRYYLAPKIDEDADEAQE